jgi:hypothetical protein
MEKLVKDKTWLERFAESQNLVFGGLAILLIPFMIHTATLLLSVSVVKWTWYAYFFAFGFDLAIFIFAAHGRRGSAGGIAIIVFLMNVSVLNLDTMYEKFDPDWVKFLITAVLSGTGAWILHSYVVMFNEKKEQRDQTVEFYDKQSELNGQIGDLTLTNNKLTLQLESLKTVQVSLEQSLAQNAELKNQLASLSAEFNSASEKLKVLEVEKLVAEKTAAIESKRVQSEEIKKEDGLILVGSSVICKACTMTFESREHYDKYKTTGLCQAKGCQKEGVELSINS